MATGRPQIPDLLLAMVNNLPCAVFVHDAEGRFREVNTAACESLGRTREELLGLDVFAVECEPQLTLLNVWRSLPVGSEQRFRGRHRHADGTTFPVTVAVRAFEHAGEKLFCVSAIQMQSDQPSEGSPPDTRQHEQDVFREVFERATEAIAIIDAEGRYLLQNQRHRELLGYDDRDLVNKTPAIHLGPAKFSEVGKGLAERGAFRGEVTSHAKDGRELPLELSAFKIGRGDRAPLFVGIKRDLRERDREGREAAERVRRELEESLRQAHKLETFGLLAAGIAHDFNNVLTLILSVSDRGAEDTALPQHAQEAFADVRDAARRGRDLTARLLEFGRRQPLAPRPLELGPRVRDLVRTLRRVVPSTIAFDVTIAKAPLEVAADAIAIEQVLMNLVTNAADAMPDGGTLAIRVGPLHVPDDAPLARTLGCGGAFVELRVSDTGAGMSKATLERLFEPFYTSKAAGKGTGLGMAIVRDIVRQHHGHIEVTSAVGRGTDVRVILPTAGLAADANARTATVLIVDDDPGMRALVARLVSKLGYRALTANDGHRALELLAEQGDDIDLVLTDLMMPGLTGSELQRQIALKRPGLPVLLMTGHAPVVTDAQGREVAVEALCKPFTLEGLGAALRKGLATRR